MELVKYATNTVLDIHYWWHYRCHLHGWNCHLLFAPKTSTGSRTHSTRPATQRAGLSWSVKPVLVATRQYSSPLGFFLYTMGLVVLLVGLYQGGNTRVWGQASVVAPIVLGALTFLGCFAWDWSGIPKRPLFPLYMLKKFREFTVLLM